MFYLDQSIAFEVILFDADNTGRQTLTWPQTSTLLQCSTLVRNTVVRAILQAYGKWWISTPWGAETGEPIEKKLGMGDYVGDPKTKSVRKGWSFEGGVKCSTQACFLGRLPKVDLIILEGGMSVRTSVRTSVRPSVRPQKVSSIWMKFDT